MSDGSALTSAFSRPARRSLTLRPAYSPRRHATCFLEGFDGVVASTVAPIATGWSDPVAGWESHPLKNPTFSRRTDMQIMCAGGFRMRLFPGRSRSAGVGSGGRKTLGGYVRPRHTSSRRAGADRPFRAGDPPGPAQQTSRIGGQSRSMCHCPIRTPGSHPEWAPASPSRAESSRRRSSIGQSQCDSSNGVRVGLWPNVPLQERGTTRGGRAGTTGRFYATRYLSVKSYETRPFPRVAKGVFYDSVRMRSSLNCGYRIWIESWTKPRNTRMCFVLCPWSLHRGERWRGRDTSGGHGRASGGDRSRGWMGGGRSGGRRGRPGRRGSKPTQGDGTGGLLPGRGQADGILQGEPENRIGWLT